VPTRGNLQPGQIGQSPKRSGIAEREAPTIGWIGGQYRKLGKRVGMRRQIRLRGIGNRPVVPRGRIGRPTVLSGPNFIPSSRLQMQRLHGKPGTGNGFTPSRLLNFAARGTTCAADCDSTENAAPITRTGPMKNSNAPMITAVRTCLLCASGVAASGADTPPLTTHTPYRPKTLNCVGAGLAQQFSSPTGEPVV
jgi:hypothetical protein